MLPNFQGVQILSVTVIRLIKLQRQDTVKNQILGSLLTSFTEVHAANLQYILFTYLFTLFHYALLQHIKYNSLYNTVGPCFFYLFYIKQFVFANLKLLIYSPLPLPPLVTISLFFNYVPLIVNFFEDKLECFFAVVLWL